MCILKCCSGKYEFVTGRGYIVPLKEDKTVFNPFPVCELDSWWENGGTLFKFIATTYQTHFLIWERNS